MQVMTNSFPLDFPTAVRIASLSPVFLVTSFNRSLYFLESVNFKKSLELTLVSSSLK